MNMFDLSGKVAIVTGASSGLGRDAAKAYAEYGADVALLARRKDKLEDVARDIEAMGRRALPLACDVTREEDIKQAVEQVVNSLGTVHILLNNAGIASVGTVETMSLEEWERSMSTNVTSMFLMGKYVVPHMRRQKYGKIVNVASINAIIADKGELARHVYNTSKAAVRGLTMGMAASYMQDGITVNSIGPGLFMSEMTEKTLFAHAGFMESFSALVPACRPGNPGELNGTIIYLSSDASSYVTSQHIIIDGGLAVV